MLIANNFNDFYGEGVALWLQSPSRRSICVVRDGEDEDDDDDSYPNADRFFLSFPSVLFRLQYRSKYGKNKDKLFLKSLRCGFLGKAKKLEDQTPIYYPPLPNIQETLFVCTGTENSALTIDQLVKEALADFWGTEFDENEMADALSNYDEETGTLSKYKKWAKKTKRKPTWTPGGKSMLKWGVYSDFAQLNTFHSTGDE